MDPYIKGNRDFPFDMDFYEKGDVDLILTSSGHADDQGDAGPHRKPDGRHLGPVVEQFGVTPETAALIGASENGISAARDAGVRSVVVTFGYTHMAPGEFGAEALIDRFRGLPGGRRNISTSLVSP